MRKLSMLPCTFTLGNAACGFAALIKTASFVKSGDEAFLVQAAWLILAAMLFDAFDGKVARITKATSDFGGQLDSLSDMVSFGLAPAALVVMWNSKLLAGSPTETLWAQITWFFCLAYAMAALLRLARFNVEMKHDEGSHMDFIGLPVPGAAGLVASLVIFRDYIGHQPARNEVVAALHSYLGAENVISLMNFLQTTMPLLMIVLAFLMVSSRMHYVHVLNKLFREKKTFDYFTYLIFGGVLVALGAQVTFPFLFGGYVALGPVGLAVRYFRSKAPTRKVSSKDTVA